eukprot:ctg_2864.g361
MSAGGASECGGNGSGQRRAHHRAEALHSSSRRGDGYSAFGAGADGFGSSSDDDAVDMAHLADDGAQYDMAMAANVLDRAPTSFDEVDERRPSEKQRSLVHELEALARHGAAAVAAAAHSLVEMLPVEHAPHGGAPVDGPKPVPPPATETPTSSGGAAAPELALLVQQQGLRRCHFFSIHRGDGRTVIEICEGHATRLCAGDYADVMVLRARFRARPERHHLFVDGELDRIARPARVDWRIAGERHAAVVDAAARARTDRIAAGCAGGRRHRCGATGRRGQTTARLPPALLGMDHQLAAQTAPTGHRVQAPAGDGRQRCLAVQASAPKCVCVSDAARHRPQPAQVGAAARHRRVWRRSGGRAVVRGGYGAALVQCRHAAAGGAHCGAAGLLHAAGVTAVGVVPGLRGGAGALRTEPRHAAGTE